MNKLLDAIKGQVKRFTRLLARFLVAATAGAVSPNMVTLFGLAMHIPIAFLIANGYHGYAAAGLVVFGLLDSLDGDLARLQGKVSTAGMLLDASTDRMKEVLLYTGAAWFLAGTDSPRQAAMAVLACGASVLVSYVKAKGETAVKDSHLKANDINRLFGDGLMRFEVRMFCLVVGLLLGALYPVLVIIAFFSAVTATARLGRISRKLTSSHD